MKVNSDISVKEKRLLNIFAFLIFSLTLINLGLIQIEILKHNGIDFCAYCYLGYIPFFRLFAILIFPFVLWSRKIYLSTIFSSLGSLTFINEIFLNFRANFENNYLFSKIEMIEFIASPLDYFVFLLISILLIWQISILIRISFVNSQMKKELK